jgi:predicted transcriptional regulator
MSASLFEELGLSPNEAKIYDTLITYGGSGVSTIALRAKVHRSNAYDALRRLIEKGLVHEVLGGRETVYEPVDPVKFKELLAEKMQKFDDALPQMARHFLTHRTAERVSVYRGIEGVKNYMRLALETGEDIYTLGGKCALLDPRLQSFTNQFSKEMRKRNMRKLSLFDAAVRDQCPVDVLRTVATEWKFLPQEHGTRSAIDVFGGYVVTFTGMEVKKLGNDMTIFVLASQDLAEDFHAWWKVMWDLVPGSMRR